MKGNVTPIEINVLLDELYVVRDIYLQRQQRQWVKERNGALYLGTVWMRCGRKPDGTKQRSNGEVEPGARSGLGTVLSAYK